MLDKEVEPMEALQERFKPYFKPYFKFTKRGCVAP